MRLLDRDESPHVVPFELERALQVLADHVRLEVHAPAPAPAPQRRHRQRVRDHHDLERRPLQRRHREADAVHRHRALRDQQRGQRGSGQLDPHPRRRFYTGHGAPRFRRRRRGPGRGGRRARRRTAAAARGSRDRPARARRAPCGRASPARGRTPSPSGAALDHREADAVDRDAGAELAALAASTRAADLEPRDVARGARQRARSPSSSTIPVNISAPPARRARRPR